MAAKYTFNIIGIGLSAGGLDPLLQIIAELSKNINAAFVVMSHTPINSSSNLHVIIRKATQLKVVAVSTLEYIEPGHIYVLAAGKELVLANGFVQVQERNPNDKINNTIDVLFNSMAIEAADKSIGVILSGAGFDGIKGAHNIEEQNGLVIVQDPETAQFPLMPQSLIANDHPDYVLTPKDIAKKIIERVQKPD